MTTGQKIVRFDKGSKDYDGIHFMKQNIISIVKSHYVSQHELIKTLSMISLYDKYKIFVFFIHLNKQITRSKRKTPLFEDIYTTYYFRNAYTTLSIMDVLRKELRRNKPVIR